MTHDQEVYSKTVLGFWIYLLTDLVMFACLFATYLVLKEGTFGGVSARDLFHPQAVLPRTLILLSVAFTSGLGGLYAHRQHKQQTLFWFALTFVMGALFLHMQWAEFSALVAQGVTWKKSGFLSAFYTFIGTHFVHVVFALIWTPLFLMPVLFHGVDATSLRRLTCLRLFWQFINFIWVFIFALVYLIGGL